MSACRILLALSLVTKANEGNCEHDASYDVDLTRTHARRGVFRGPADLRRRGTCRISIDRVTRTTCLHPRLQIDWTRSYGEKEREEGREHEGRLLLKGGKRDLCSSPKFCAEAPSALELRPFGEPRSDASSRGDDQERMPATVRGQQSLENRSGCSSAILRSDDDATARTVTSHHDNRARYGDESQGKNVRCYNMRGFRDVMQCVYPLQVPSPPPLPPRFVELALAKYPLARLT